MSFETVRRKFGEILRQSVPPKSLKKIIDEADTQGRVDARALIKMITTLYEYLEENQDENREDSQSTHV